MCSKCSDEDKMHLSTHKKSIMSFGDYLQYIAMEIKKVIHPNVSTANKEIKRILENEGTL
jgi:hypothetical protein